MGIVEAPKTRHLLEFKTANTKYFNKVKKHGLYASMPEYFATVQRYMGAKKLTRCFYVVVCKDTDERHYERIHFDKEYYNDLIKRERDIIMSDRPPLRYFEAGKPPCLWCNSKDVCDGVARAEKNCRTCDHADLEDKGIWICNFHKKELSYSAQIEGCRHHTYGWNL